MINLKESHAICDATFYKYVYNNCSLDQVVSMFKWSLFIESPKFMCTVPKFIWSVFIVSPNSQVHVHPRYCSTKVHEILLLSSPKGQVHPYILFLYLWSKQKQRREKRGREETRSFFEESHIILNKALTLIRMNKDEKVLAIFKGLML